jgi:hypothetical protein
VANVEVMARVPVAVGRSAAGALARGGVSWRLKAKRGEASVERPRVDPRAFGARSRCAPRALRAARGGLYKGVRPVDVSPRARRSSPRLSI